MSGPGSRYLAKTAIVWLVFNSVQKMVGRLLYELGGHIPNQENAPLILNDEAAEEQEREGAVGGSRKPLKKNLVTLKSTDPEHPHSWSMVNHTSPINCLLY